MSDFTLDTIFDSNVAQVDFYRDVVSGTIKDTLNGYNGTVFTYGQSGSGKTYTMLGDDISKPELRGIIPRAMYYSSLYLENRSSITSKTRITIISLK